MQKRIYLDYAAATPVDPEVASAMDKFSAQNFGNASAIYKEGRESKKALSDAREGIAKILSAHADEIIFTSGGTEANNLAIFGAAKNKGHIITSAFEHKSVLEPIKKLEKEGFGVTYLKVSKDGFIDPKDMASAIKDDTFLVSIMYVNNEIGTIQPMREISKAIKSSGKNIFFHTDACQAAGHLDLDVEKLGVDLMSFSGAKIYGPKGVGMLYKKRGINLAPQILGGGQEMGFRSGTEPVGLAVGMAKAFEISRKMLKTESARLGELRDNFANSIREIPGVEINGSLQNRIPSNLSVSFRGVSSERMIIALDEAGVAVSSGSACDARLPDLPHVIMSLGKVEEIATSVIRFSFGKDTTKEDIDYVLSILPNLINKFRI